MTAALSSRPRLRPDVVLGPEVGSGATRVHHVKDPRAGCYYRVGVREFFVMSRLDGRHTLAQIAEEYADRFDRRLGPDQWRQLFTLLGRRQLVDGMADEASLERTRAARAEREKGQRNPLRRRMPLAHPDRFCAAAAARLRPLFTLWFLVPALLAVTALEAFVATHAVALASDLRAGPGLLGLSGPVTATVLAIVATWLYSWPHELAHGVTCRHFGGTVPEIGMMWRFPLIAPYCRTDDIVLFGRRSARIATAFAGMFTTLLLLFPVLGWWALTSRGGLGHAVASGILLIGSAATLANLLPFLQLDGYMMVNHALGTADLRADSYRWWRHLLGWHRPEHRSAARAYPRSARWIYTGYGIATGLFLVAGGALLVTIWYRTMASWWGAPVAVGLLLGEAAAVTALLVLAVRRRRSGGSPTRSEAAQPSPPAEAPHA